MGKKPNKTKELLFSITKKDLIIDTFKSGGKGGQHQNKTDSAVRVKHPESGAVGVSRSERSQHANKKIAFNKMANSKKFKDWVRIHSAAVEQGFRDVEHKVDEMMKPQNLKIEFLPNDKEK